MKWKVAAVFFGSMALAVLGTGQDAAQKKAAPTTESASKGPCADWTAWDDRMPGKKPTLHVKGTCTFPTGGYKVSLKRAKPQGINPKILILDLNIVKPTGTVNQQITKVDAKFDEQTNAMYTDVTIRPDNITVPVKITQ